ncbi:hypothetical protein [Pelosinus baikalensis]|uniref:Uncharacterized protein n=1 Tax=Pelosinus baikalensis TaxID=2892015 RepID=A0ABS8HXQ7_9FIRM|nr:hypothetical protein [Pelosinus baikalensis]MCC5467757.1 hypothetical protein [Pelosinus baikalensis]
MKVGYKKVKGLMLMCGTLIAMVVNMLMGIGNDTIGVHYPIIVSPSA